MPTHLCDRPECGELTLVAFHVDRQEWIPRFWALEHGRKRMYCSEECLELDLSRIMSGPLCSYPDCPERRADGPFCPKHLEEFKLHCAADRAGWGIPT